MIPDEIYDNFSERVKGVIDGLTKQIALKDTRISVLESELRDYEKSMERANGEIARWKAEDENNAKMVDDLEKKIDAIIEKKNIEYLSLKAKKNKEIARLKEELVKWKWLEKEMEK